MIIPGFFNNSGKRLSILVHFTFGEQALDQFSGNRVNDKHGGRAKNHIRRTGGIRTPHDFCGFFRNHLEFKRSRGIARHLFGVHQPEYKFFPGGIFEICFFNIFPGKNITPGTP